MNFINTKYLRYSARNRFEFYSPAPNLSEELEKNSFNSQPNIHELFPEFLVSFLTSKTPLSFSAQDLIYRELELHYLHDYIGHLSKTIIDLIDHYYHNIEEIRKYEGKLLQLLDLFKGFLSLESRSAYVDSGLVLHHDSFLQLLLYSDNFELINMILLMINFRRSSISRLCWRNISEKNKKLLPCFTQFLFADRESSKNFNTYYEFFYQDENFKKLKSELDPLISFTISDKPYFEQTDHLKLSLKFKDSCNTEKHKKIEVKHIMTIYHKDKPSVLIAQQILKENHVENLLENSYESYIKLVLLVKYIKLQSDPKRAIYNLINCQTLARLKDIHTSHVDPDRDYSFQMINRDQLAFFHAPKLCLQDERALKNLLNSFGCQKPENFMYSYKRTSQKKIEYFMFFNRNGSYIINVIQGSYPNNLEILSLMVKNILLPILQMIEECKRAECFKDLFESFDNIFQTYFVENEEFVKDPVDLLQNLDRQILFKSMLLFINDQCKKYNPNSAELHQNFLSKIIRKIFETLIFSEETHRDLMQRYPNLLVVEEVYENLAKTVVDLLKKEKDPCSEIFLSGKFFQTLLQKIKTSDSQLAYDFYIFFLESFAYDIFQTNQNVSKEEKQAFYCLLKEACLKKKRVIGRNNNYLFRKWIEKTLSNYPTIQEMEKSPQDFSNFKIYLKIQFDLTFICSMKENSGFVSISPLQPFSEFVYDQILEYFESIIKEISKPDFENLKNQLNDPKLFLKNARISSYYLTFMLFRARKVKRGSLIIFSNFNEMKSRLLLEQATRLFELITELVNTPLLLGIRESHPIRSMRNYNLSSFTIENKEGKQLRPLLVENLINEAIKQFEQTEPAFHRLMKAAQKNRIPLLELFSNKVILTFSSNNLQKTNWDFVNSNLKQGLCQVHYENSLDDLRNLQRMKFIFALIRDGNLFSNPNDIAKAYFKLCENLNRLSITIIEIFSRDFLPMLWHEYYQNCIQTYNPPRMNYPSDEYNVFYNIIRIYSNSDYPLLKGFKFPKRIYHTLKKLNYFAIDYLSDNKELLPLVVKFMDKSCQELVDHYDERKPENLAEAHQIFIHNNLINHLLNIFASTYGLSTIYRKKILRKVNTIAENAFEFCKNNGINLELSKNTFPYHKITEEKFQKISLLHICFFSCSTLFSLLKKALANISKEKSRLAVLDKLNKRLPYFKSLTRNVAEMDYHFGRFKFLPNIISSMSIVSYPDDDNGAKCRNNASKMFKIVLEESLNLMMRWAFGTFSSTHCSYYLMFFIEKLFKTVRSDEGKTRKAFFMKLLPTLQKMTEIMGSNQIWADLLSQVSECQDIKEFVDSIDFVLDFDEKLFLSLSSLKKLEIFQIFITTVALVGKFDERDPDANISYKKLISFSTFKIIISISLNFKDKLIQEKDYEKGKKILDFLIGNALTQFEDDFRVYCALTGEEQFKRYLEVMDLLTIVFQIYNDNRGEIYNDTQIILEIMIEILGNLNFNEFKDISVTLLQKIWSIVREMKENYFGRSNSVLITLILTKLLTFYDKDQNLQKATIELKIKEFFYDDFLSEKKKQQTLNDFSSCQDLTNIFAFDGKTFFQVFSLLCKVSEDKEHIFLKEDVELDKFYSIENLTFAKEIIEIFENILDGIISSLAFVVNHFASCYKDQKQGEVKSYLAQNHMMLGDILSTLIDRFPPLITLLCQYQIPIEVLGKFKSCNFLYESLVSHCDSQKKINIIDFLWHSKSITNFNTCQIYRTLIRYNYIFKEISISYKNCIVPSSMIWKQEILTKCILQLNELFEGKKIFDNFRNFNEYYSCLALTLHIYNKNESMGMKILPFEEIISKALYAHLTSLVTYYKEPKYIPFLKLNMLVPSILKKVHNRLIRLAIFRRKQPNLEKVHEDDKNYLKYYAQQNFSSIASSEVSNTFSLKTSHYPSLIPTTEITKISCNNCFLKQGHTPSYSQTINEQLPSYNHRKIYQYYRDLGYSYENIDYMKIYRRSTFSIKFDWITETKSSEGLLADQVDLETYNDGITYDFYQFMSTMGKTQNYAQIEDILIRRAFNRGDQGSLNEIDSFIKAIISNEFPELKNNQKEPQKQKEEEINRQQEEEINKQNHEPPKQDVTEKEGNSSANEDSQKEADNKLEEMKKEEIFEDSKKEDNKLEETKKEEPKQQEEVKKEEFDFISNGFPIDSIQLFGIDISYFSALDEATKLAVLRTEQKKYDEKTAQEIASKPLEKIGISSYNFEANGFPLDALKLYSIDLEYFNSLSEDLKKGVLEQARSEYNKKEERKKALEEKERKDPSLKKLRVLAILENAALLKLAREHGVNYKEVVSEEDWKKLCDGVNELVEESKNYILRSLPYEIIRDLPEELRKSAKRLRKKYGEFDRDRAVPRENEDSSSPSQLSSNEQDSNPSENDKYEEVPEIEDPIREKPEENILFDGRERNENLEKIFTDLSFYSELPELDEDIFQFIVNCLSSIKLPSDDFNQFQKLLISFAVNPKNIYRMLDFWVSFVTLQQEYSSAIAEKNEEVISSVFHQKFLNQQIYDYSGRTRELDLRELQTKYLKIFMIFAEKKLWIPILVNGYSFGCTALIFDNQNYPSFSVTKEFREVLSKRKIEARKETIYEKLLLLNDEENSSTVAKTFSSLIQFKEDLGDAPAVYPKVVVNTPKNIIANCYASNLDYISISSIFTKIEDLFGVKNIDMLINFALKTIFKEMEKWPAEQFKTKKEKILQYKKEKKLIEEIISMKDQYLKDLYLNYISNITVEDSSNLRTLRRGTRLILKKLRVSIKKYAKYESKKLIDSKIKEENPGQYNELRKEQYHKKVQEIISMINEKIHQEESVLQFFREYFEYCYVILNVVGTDSNFDHDNDSIPKTIFSNQRHCFKLFFDLYRFLNPIGEEYKKKETESEVQTRQNGSKLSKLRTSAPEEEKEVNFKLEKIEKIFDAFARKADLDISLENTLGMAYGRFASVVEIFIQYGLDKFDEVTKISSVYHYYVEKAPNEHSVSTHLKFTYLSSLANKEAEKKCPGSDPPSHEILLERNAIWQSTLNYLLRKTPSEIARARISVEFKNEMGIDAGGLTREWLTLLVKEVFDPEKGLFKVSQNKISYQPNPLSFIVPDHLTHFRMLGRLIAKALIENWNIEVFFVKSFLKHILQKTLFVNDLQDVDAELYNSMKWMMENPIDNMGFVFSYEKKEFDRLKTIEIVPNGNQIDVTEENKKEFVKAMAYAKMAKEIEVQTEAMIQGITEIIPAEGLAILNEKDLGVRLAGVPSINVDEMEKYCLFYSHVPKETIVVWLFEILREFDEDMKAKFLFYIFGCFRVPIGGFKAFPIMISSLPNTKSLPIAHTCFGQIDIPNYSSKEVLKEKLILAITEGGGTGFFFE